MTAREKLNQLKEEWKRDSRPYNGPAGREIFEKKHHVTEQRRCCEFCRFGVPDFEGECSCLHPERIQRDKDGVLEHIWLEARLTNVCDEYKERTPENKDIDYGGTEDHGNPGNVKDGK